MEESANLATAVELGALLLEATDAQHFVEQAESVLPSDLTSSVRIA
jgi:hypothetical protein